MFEKFGLHAARRTKGYVYVSAEDGGPMAVAKTGATIRAAKRGPPWIVVDHELSSVIVAKWPGRLWSVEVTDPVTAKDQAAVGGPPISSAQYTRAVGVQIAEELPASMLFGPHGDAVSTVIDAARTLNAEQAAKLSAARHPDAGRAYDRIWRAWLRDRGLQDADAEDSLDGTLATGGVRPASPINSGLSVLHNELFRRAKALSGDAATETDGDDIWLVDPWHGACAALLDVALASGAPELVGSTDGEILAFAWRAVRA
jgi:hypothetical protein